MTTQSTNTVPVRQHLASRLRGAGVLQAVEGVRFVKHLMQNYPTMRKFRRAHPGEQMPPSWLLYEASSSLDYPRYWNSGRARAAYLTGLAREHLDEPVAICDWGCGPGRVVRHLALDQSGMFNRVIGTDYNANSIRWCAAHLPNAQFLVNQLAPPLPLDDGSVDMLYGFSVLTHLSRELAAAWMAELARVVRSGGLILVSTHGDGFREKLIAEEREAYDRGEYVERGLVKEGSRLYVGFHPPRYVRDVLARGWEVVLHRSIGPLDISSGQDIWLFRRP
jgi:SAM-dependent methyltransferase